MRMKNSVRELRQIRSLCENCGEELSQDEIEAYGTFCEHCVEEEA